MSSSATLKKLSFTSLEVVSHYRIFFIENDTFIEICHPMLGQRRRWWTNIRKLFFFVTKLLPNKIMFFYVIFWMWNLVKKLLLSYGYLNIYLYIISQRGFSWSVLVSDWVNIKHNNKCSFTRRYGYVALCVD